MNSILNESFSNLTKNASSTALESSVPVNKVEPSKVQPVERLPKDNVQISEKASEANFKFRIEASLTIFKGSTQAANFKFEQSGEADEDTISKILEELAEMMQEMIREILSPDDAQYVNNVLDDALTTAVDLFTQTIGALEQNGQLASPAEQSYALINDFAAAGRSMIQSAFSAPAL